MKKVMVFGTFDVLHPGHLNLFKQAKRYGGKLIVVVSRDQVAHKVKGHSPTNKEKDRLALVTALRVVDQTVLGHLFDRLHRIKQIKPDVVCLGYDQIAFVSEMKKAFPKLKVVRLKSYKPRIYKSSKFKKW